MNDLAEVEELISDGAVSAHFGDRHPNPHIKAFAAESLETQLKKLSERGFADGCLYPERQHLETVLPRDAFIDRPYTRQMALGSPQLEHVAFELSVLERYRNDPRYHYSHDDISGQFGISGEFYEDGNTPRRDQVGLQSFGFCFDESEHNCYVAVFNRYLNDLSPTHQQYWKGFDVSKQTFLHPDYFRSSIQGEFPERVSLYTATLLEMQLINEAALAINGKSLFKNDFLKAAPPNTFSRLIRPTSKEFDTFIHVLDKLLSENIDATWFPEDVSRTELIKRKSGESEVRNLGTIRILENWITSKFKPADADSIGALSEAVRTLKDVRKLRQRPAHALDDNHFSLQVARDQRDLMIRVYNAMKCLRQLLMVHPRARGLVLDEILQEGLIWTA